MRTAAVSPRPASALRHSRTDIPEEPTSSSMTASASTASTSANRTAVFFFCKVFPMRGLPRSNMLYHTPYRPAVQPGEGVPAMQKCPFVTLFCPVKKRLSPLTAAHPWAIL